MKIETHKAHATGMGYHVAELEEPWPDSDSWGLHWYPDIDKWCEDTFGPQDLWGEKSVTGWKRMRNKYFFVEETTLSWFLIKWL
jgi:hypothetical protein